MSYINSQKFLYFSFAYTLFIIYGSLVPLDYRPIPFEEALLSFRQIRYLDLGVASRADWVSNIILYIPLTFSLAASFLISIKSPVKSFFVATFILAFSLTLAITVEFYQQFFPPRTVSQNDLIAETIGSVIGLTLWIGYGKPLQKLFTHILRGGKDALLASAILYTLAYLALSFFPYDFVTSFQELQNKLAKGGDTFFLSSSCGGFIPCTTKLVAEVFIIVPLGIFLTVLLKWHSRRRTAIMLIGFILGAIIEIIQLFLISGIAQGISVFTRILGLELGEYAYSKINALKKPFITIDFRKYLIIACFPYILLLALLSGWEPFSHTDTFSITEKIDKINWLPFYYHYYTSEAVALTSLLSIFAMYLPIGLGVWLWHYNNKNSTHKMTAGLFAVILCFIMETGKLFFAGQHPDPTNLLISFASAFITYSLATLIYRWLQQPETDIHTQSEENQPAYFNKKQKTTVSAIPDNQAGNPLAKGIAIIITAILLWKALDYPGSFIGLTGTLLLYGILLRKYSQAWLIIIPALLPIADFSPWTGRLFFSELDYFIILTFVISLWYRRWSSPFQSIKPAALLLFAIFLFCYSISLLRGLLPWQAIDANAFTNYYSQYNSLRVAKGLIWATLFLPILIYDQNNHDDIKKHFTYGLLTGLTATVLFAIRERAIFTGLFDYSADFRITSTFYSMHTGGAPLDAYLVLSIPFICLLLIESKNNLIRTLFIPFLFTTSLYTLLVTYSRGTYIAIVFTFLVLIIGLFICYKNQRVTHWKRAIWLPLFLILAAVVTIPVLKGSFIQHRFNQAHQEVGTRSNHWLNAISMMDTGFLTTSFGMGLGSFPRNYLWNNFKNKVPATFSVQHEKNYDYIQLGSGRPLYIEQIVDLSADTVYKLNLDYRSDFDNTHLDISICEKAIQHSFSCKGVVLAPKKTHTNWQQFEHIIDIQDIGISNRPTKLIMHNSRQDTSIDIKNISLSTANKDNLLTNGNFSKGMDHWFFTTDDHIPWRIENLWVQILFEQGWLGLISFCLILLYTIAYHCKRLLRQDYYSAVTLSSLTGFFIVGVIDSSFDQPIISLLFFMIIYVSFLNSDQKDAIELKRQHKTSASRKQQYGYL